MKLCIALQVYLRGQDSPGTNSGVVIGGLHSLS